MTSEVFLLDCMEGMQQWPDKYFDLAIVDPPYGINAAKMAMGENLNREPGKSFKQSTANRIRKGRLNSGGGKLKNRALNNLDCNWDEQAPGKEYFTELFRVSKHQIIFGGNYFELPPTRCIICWDKIQPWDNFSAWEMAWTSFDYPAKLYRLSSRGGANNEVKIHPTQKPVKLYNRVFRDFAAPGMKVLDTHLGSGSSRISAYSYGLDFYGYEINENFFIDQQTRFAEFKKQHLLFNPVELARPAVQSILKFQ